MFRAFGPPPEALIRAPLMAGISEKGSSNERSCQFLRLSSANSDF